MLRTLCFFGLLILLTSCGGGENPRVYHNDTYDFTLQLPVSWNYRELLDETGFGSIIFSGHATKIAAHFAIRIDNQQLDLTEFFEQQLAFPPQVESEDVLDSILATTVGTLPLRVMQFQVEGIRHELCVAVLERQERFFAFRLEHPLNGPDTTLWREQFLKMIRSLDF
ncbi:MAG: hypothetical protein ISR91_00365 [Candidatus Delongbacteria bacterium]|nr:hypothetical protein [bacterium]MBL7032576.1 hypothetical protein [Candidatus Delongbacteria bacterium]